MRNNKKWGSRDRRFFAETVYDCVRWWKLYTYLLGDEEPSETLPVIAVSLWHRGMEIPYIDEFNHLKPDVWGKKFAKISDLHIKESIPQWLFDYAKNDLGNVWEEILPYLNKPNKLVLRVNQLKSNKNQLIQFLQEQKIEALELDGCENGLIVPERANVFKTEAFKKGWFEVQDGSSQQVASYLQVEPGMRVVDACAGAGGKTLHIADILQNRGKIISMDIHQWKLDQLKLRARRNGYSNIELKLIESSKTIKRLKGTADRLLLDVPCTGLGVLRRNPDTKWKVSDSSIKELLKTQKDILNQYSKMLKPQGLMVYATCSVLNCENGDQVQSFLNENKDFELLKQKRIYPTRDGFDGFYMALLRKFQ